MKTFLSLIALLLFNISLYSQDISGYWQGVVYSPNSAYSEYWAEVLLITQNGNMINGTTLNQAANDPQIFHEAEINGTIQNNLLQITTGNILRANPPPPGTWCYLGNGTFVYDPVELSLKGALTYSNCPLTGNFEVYLLKLKTKNRFCKDEKINLEVSGKNIKWYQDENKTKLLGTGNFFEPSISQTTTFYVTQTHYNTESPVAPIKIEITDTQIEELKIVEATCTLNKGSLTIIAKGDAPTG